MMKVIIINEVNKERLLARLEEGQRLAKVRTVGLEELEQAIKELEKKLSIVSKKSREGLTVEVSPFAERYPNAYKYIPTGTAFSLIYKGGKWRLGSVWREDINKVKRYSLTLPEQLKKSILQAFTAF